MYVGPRACCGCFPLWQCPSCRGGHCHASEVSVSDNYNFFPVSALQIAGRWINGKNPQTSLVSINKPLVVAPPLQNSACQVAHLQSCLFSVFYLSADALHATDGQTHTTHTKEHEGTEAQGAILALIWFFFALVWLIKPFCAGAKAAVCKWNRLTRIQRIVLILALLCFACPCK